ncbi:MAG: Rne/Rng family ribonuclease [Rickettsiaceae bacterium]
MKKTILIDCQYKDESRVVVINNEDHSVIDIGFQDNNNPTQRIGNIFLAKITRVEPSLQAAFVDYGGSSNGFLPFNEIHRGYYQISNGNNNNKDNIANTLGKFPSAIDGNAVFNDQIEDSIDDNSDAKNTDNINNDASNTFTTENINDLADGNIKQKFELDINDNDIEHINIEKFNEIQQLKSYSIQDVIKKGQLILVQITKLPRGNKGASFTTYICLAGRYCVFMPNRSFYNGVSRKIASSAERQRIKKIITQFNPETPNDQISLIARTAAIGRSAVEIEKDYKYLVNLWNKIRDVTFKSKAPCFIHAEEGVIQKIIQDTFDNNTGEIIIQGKEAYDVAIKFMSSMLPEEVNKIKEYKDEIPLFKKFNVESKIANLYQPIIDLPSGGYIIINPTEALTAIDINSGKSNSEMHIEETALSTNMEAAKVIAHQIKLRDLSGLLIVDFIDMQEQKNKRIIENLFKEELSKDRARIQALNLNIFGLFEFSRQRSNPSFLELNTMMCDHCNGKGVVRADQSNARLILRTIESEICNTNVDLVNVYSSVSSIMFLLNNKRKEIAQLENKYSVKIDFKIDFNATADSYSIEKILLTQKKFTTNLSDKPALELGKELKIEKANNDKEELDKNSEVNTTKKNTIKRKMSNTRQYKKRNSDVKKADSE